MILFHICEADCPICLDEQKILYDLCAIGKYKTCEMENNMFFSHDDIKNKICRFSGHRKKSGLGQGIRMSRKYERNDKIALLYPPIF